MPETYLFIPFGTKENNSELYAMAERWEFAQIVHKAQFAEIIVYGKDKIPELKSGDQIYILGHSYPIDHYIANIADITNPKNFVLLLTPTQLATRMVESGLIFFNAQAKIKLYFCDENQRAKDIAESFMESLVAINQRFAESNLQISYYSGILTVPWTKTLENEEVPYKLIHKHAGRHPTDTDSKSSVISLPGQYDFVHLGRASHVRTNLSFLKRTVDKSVDEINAVDKDKKKKLGK